MTDLAELRSIERDAVALLVPLGSASATELIAALKPDDADYARVFVGDAAAQARRGYDEMWTNPPGQLARPGQIEVQAFATLAAAFLTDNERSQEFPGGYRKIAAHLRPDVVWLRFKYTAPGQTSGMAYDGLVRLDGRWAWFPKPWRVLPDATIADN